MASRGESEVAAHRDSIFEVLAEEYYSKPGQGLAGLYDLVAFDLANDLVSFDIRQPALDLGCGNGAFGSAFCRSLGFDGFDLGMDLKARDVREATRRGPYKFTLQSDARVIPIKTGTIRFILSHGVLCCIHPGHELALLEVARILETGGQFVMTVPTPGWTSALFPTRLFEFLGFQKLARFYSRKTDERNGHRVLQNLEAWRKDLESVDLKIESYIQFTTKSETAWWGVLNMRPFQVFAVFRYLPGFMQRLAVGITKRLLNYVSTLTHPDEKECGFLLIVARKV